MRLLQRGERGEYSLRTFAEVNSIPPYAILSHTWGLDHEEVSFGDIMNGTGEEKRGYEKIRFCEEQANRDDLQYFWIDSCCINKDDGAELSRSISSMYLWYRNAAQCYVYLLDISTLKRKKDDDSRDSWEANFSRSRWFMRGWTLQELLAPASVKFFARDRTLLGDKKSLGPQIKMVTNIPLAALEGDPLAQYSVPERMSWIEHRDTKIEEDRAYSLLGIFGVRISPQYGEGRASAFKRLHDEIDKLEKCILDLRLTDPRDDKRRIEETKGGLLEGAYHWILKNPDFQQWRSPTQNKLLWIKGDPGKGKTMLLCGIVDDLKKSMAKSDLLSFFFCQATDSRINNATAVLRGLIYLLVYQQPSLISHARNKYDHAGMKLFEDANAWTALSEIFNGILKDSSFNTAYLVLDALDECAEGQANLLDIIARTSSMPQVRWLVSSRNWSQIEERLEQAGSKTKLCLELNADFVSAAVDTFIQHKVCQLTLEKKYDNKTHNAVLEHLRSNAHGTFLWVALVYQNLKTIPRARVRARLTSFPPGLDSFYEQMMTQISNGVESKLCKQILATIATVYKPIYLAELTSLVEALEDTADNIESLHEVIGLCGSFLTVRNDTIYFVHQSAKDYLLAKAAGEIFPIGQGAAHNEIFLRSLQVLSKTLRRDIYNLRALGYTIEQVEKPNPDPLAASRYSCVYWADHFYEWSQQSTDSLKPNVLALEKFMQTRYLYWLEALSLSRSMSEGVIAIEKLEALVKNREEGWFKLLELVRDARRFIMSHKLAIETSPLQVYASALVFGPGLSLIRNLFRHEEPSWISVQPPVPADWGACLQTLEGHNNSVNSVTFSHDSARLASASWDNTVRIWDASSGRCLQSLLGHSDAVNSVAFSHDSAWLASASNDNTVRIWDASSGKCLQTLNEHNSAVISAAFSQNSMWLASASDDGTVKIWDTNDSACFQTLECQKSSPRLFAFSHTLTHFATTSNAYRVVICDLRSGKRLQMLTHRYEVKSITFSPDSIWLVSATKAGMVKIWDASSGKCLQTLEEFYATSMAFSKDCARLAMATNINTVIIWDAANGECLQILDGYTYDILSMDFSPNSVWLASSLEDGTVKIWNVDRRGLQKTFDGYNRPTSSTAFSPEWALSNPDSQYSRLKPWDVSSTDIPQTPECHGCRVNSVVFSPDGAWLASASVDCTVKLWDARMFEPVRTFEGHNESVESLTFSPNSALLASVSDDRMVKIWNVSSGDCLQTFESDYYDVSSMAFSSDSAWFAFTRGDYASKDFPVRILDIRSGEYVQTLRGHDSYVNSVAFSLCSRFLASVSKDETVKLWDTCFGKCLRTFEGHNSFVTFVTFSPNPTRLASASIDNTIKLWDTRNGKCLQTFKGHRGHVISVTCSPDSVLLASSGAVDGLVKIWDVSSGECLHTFNVGMPLHRISFDITSSYLHTTAGVIAFAESPSSTPRIGLDPQIPRYQGWGFSSDHKWITYKSENQIWLPSEYRPICLAVSEKVIASGDESGKVVLYSFDNDIHNSSEASGFELLEQVKLTDSWNFARGRSTRQMNIHGF